MMKTISEIVSLLQQEPSKFRLAVAELERVSDLNKEACIRTEYDQVLDTLKTRSYEDSDSADSKQSIKLQILDVISDLRVSFVSSGNLCSVGVIDKLSHLEDLIKASLK